MCIKRLKANSEIFKKEIQWSFLPKSLFMRFRYTFLYPNSRFRKKEYKCQCKSSTKSRNFVITVNL